MEKKERGKQLQKRDQKINEVVMRRRQRMKIQEKHEGTKPTASSVTPGKVTKVRAPIKRNFFFLLFLLFPVATDSH